MLKRNVKSPLKVKAGIVVKISSILTDKTGLKNRTEGIGTIGKRDMDGSMTDLTSNSNHKHLTDIKHQSINLGNSWNVCLRHGCALRKL